MSEALHLTAFLISVLCFVMSFASWVLASINIRRMIAFRSSYAPIDPTMLVFGVLASAWFLGIVTIGHRSLFRAKFVVGVVGMLIAWVFALGVSYAARRWKGPNNCPDSGVFPDGCRGRWKGLLAFCWTNFILMSIYVGLVFALVTKQSSMRPRRDKKKPWDIPVDLLAIEESDIHEENEKVSGQA